MMISSMIGMMYNTARSWRVGHSALLRRGLTKLKLEGMEDW